MEKIKKLKKNGLTVVDFFCGAGIGAVGIEKAGFKTVFAFDYNKHAVNAYNHNFPKHNAQVLDANKLTNDDIPMADVYIGGFPCQPFSISGKNLGKEDPDKGNLGQIICDFIITKKPKSFFLENVKGLANKRNIGFLNELISYLSTEYNVTYEIINCADYGVPQERERVFIIGIRKDLNARFEFPEKSSFRYSILDAIGDLPKKPNNINNHDDLKSFKVRNDEKPFIDKVPEGGNWKSLPIKDQKAFMKKGYYSGGGRTGALRKVDPNKPAKTILSTPMGKATAQILDWGIGDPRRYTVRESLRLQTVPDSYIFPDNVSPNKQYERCSGIPSLVAYKFMIEIEKILKK